MRRKLLHFTFFLATILYLPNCRKNSSITPIPVLTTTNATNITRSTAVSGGLITSDGGAIVTVRGVCWSTTQNPTSVNYKTIDSSGTGSFTSSLTGLTPNTTYYVRAYATNSVVTAYGNEVSFKSLQIGLPVLTTDTVSSITQTRAQSGGNISSDGGAPVTARGVCYGTIHNPTTANDKTIDRIDSSGTGAFTSLLTGLMASTTYYVKAYATNSVGTAYGNEVSFNSLPIGTPVLTTTNANSTITQTTAQSGGYISSDGGAAVTARGVCWSINQNPTTADNTTHDGTGTGSFISSLTGLTPGTTYYYKAYATNSVGTNFGNELSFITIGQQFSLSTYSAYNITQTTAASGGRLYPVSLLPSIVAYGVCWSTSPNPTIIDSKSVGTDIHKVQVPYRRSYVLFLVFSSSLTGLTTKTTYYYRAYVTTTWGTDYGTQFSLTTP